VPLKTSPPPKSATKFHFSFFFDGIMSADKIPGKTRRDSMKILFPIDESPFSILAAQTVIEQAKPQNAVVLVLHIMDVLANLSMYDSYGTAADIKKIEEDREGHAGELVEQAAKAIRDAGLTVTSRVERGEPKSAIVEIAKEWRADLIVIGSHGRKGVDHFLLGGVSEAVARYASCSVLIVRNQQLIDRTEETKNHTKCAHPACTCIPRSGKYCSAPCEAIETMPDIDCRCGHAECKGRAH
jgi:nucleotide-binding universal stress UspA family protein